MSAWLTRKQLRHMRAGTRSGTPIPTQIVSNGEFLPSRQSAEQGRVEALINELASRYGCRHGMGRREFLQTSSGMAAAFIAMNAVYGLLFDVAEAEAADPGTANARANRLSKQFIFDNQLHFVGEHFRNQKILDLRKMAPKLGNQALEGEDTDFTKIQFRNFVKEIFVDSDTKIGLLSGAPSDKKENWFLYNEQIAQARASVNAIAGSTRLLCHAVITPGQPGWLDAIDQAITVLKPDSWKAYTVGDPLAVSRYPYRLDDEKLMYPAYEKMVKAGIRNVCIHKGLLPMDYQKSMPDTWKYAKVDDVGKAAKDWPGLNFIIYHSAIKPGSEPAAEHLAQFEQSGRIDWVTDLAEIPHKHGVRNVYAELGTVFATSCVTHPRFAAGILGTLIKGMGVDHVVWGTDSVWHGSPQWQLEALRRIEIPEDLQSKFGFRHLGAATGETKSAILGGNGARLYELDISGLSGATINFGNDRFVELRERLRALGIGRSNLAYGYVSR